jgi:exonuclease SbcD
MRLLHTSDWHLGRSLFGASLLEDQVTALDDFVRLAAESRLDAVVIAGDVYDRSAPPADAVRLLDETLTRLVLGHGIPVVLIAGNHDSGERLGFVSRLLVHRGLHVAGMEPVTAVFEDDHGLVEVVAVPFCEPAAVAARLGDPSIVDHDGALLADLVAREAASASDRRAPATKGRARESSGPRRVAVAHAFVAGGSTSESERPLVLGNAALVPASRFDGFSYVALGHLHRPQRIGRDELRYSGSLLKYSFDEATQDKSVSVVEIDGRGECRIEAVRLRRRRDLRVLEGTLEELQRAAETDNCRDDYVFVRLQDRGVVLDAIGKLRRLWPNCLRVALDCPRDAQAPRVERRGTDELELFDGFFREVTGGAPDDSEARAFADALVVVQRELATA